MEEGHTYYETLITKYLTGEANSEEVSELLVWLKKSSDNLRIFMEMRHSWFLQHVHYLEEVIDLDEEWEAMSENFGITEKPAGRKLQIFSKKYLSVAAAVILLLIIPALAYFLFFMQPTKNTLFAADQVLESSLPDGTQVTLNTGSILYYPSSFTGRKRKVSLEGEAFFDVTHNEEKAFVINADDLKITVLGTSFYVNTFAEGNSMEVVLLSGSIKLSFHNINKQLEMGEKAVLLKQSGEILIEQNKDINLLAWKTRTLRFNDTPLPEIIDVLENVYHKKIIVLNPEINNCRITATFKGQSLEAVLQVIESTIDVSARSDGNTIELTGTGCQQNSNLIKTER